MKSTTYNLVWIYWSVLAVLVTNGVLMLWAVHLGEGMRDPEPALKMFMSMEFRFITIWNVILQILYIVLSLFCEFDDLNKEKKWVHRQAAEKFRTSFFCGIVFPTTVALCAIFWGIYLYDRELILPSYTDAVLHPLNNHVVHTVVVIFVLLEVAYNPRRPENHWHHVKLLTYLQLAYAATVYFTKWQKGAYPYPVLNMVSPTGVVAMVTMSYIVSLFAYVSQWTLTPVLKNLAERKIMVL